jgi:hypothetical protein
MKPSVIVWDLETAPDLGGFAAANDLVGKSAVEVRGVAGFVCRCYYLGASHWLRFTCQWLERRPPSGNGASARLPTRIWGSATIPLRDFLVSANIPTGLDCAGLVYFPAQN